MIMIIDPKTKEIIKTIIKKATENPYSFDDLKKIPDNRDDLPDDHNMEFSTIIQPFFTITYTHEYQKEILTRHFSISNLFPQWLPTPAQVSLIMDLFGFKNKLDDCIIHLEDITEIQKAINVIEAIDITMEEWEKISEAEEKT